MATHTITEQADGSHERFILEIIGRANFQEAERIQRAGWYVDVERTAGRLQSYYTYDEGAARWAAAQFGIAIQRPMRRAS